MCDIPHEPPTDDGRTGTHFVTRGSFEGGHPFAGGAANLASFVVTPRGGLGVGHRILTGALALRMRLVPGDAGPWLRFLAVNSRGRLRLSRFVGAGGRGRCRTLGTRGGP